MASPKVVIITGATSGIGLASAISFASRGWKTYAGVRTLSKTQNITDAAKLLKVPSLLEPLELDVSKTESVKAAVARVLAANNGRLDALVNNAGFGISGPIESLSEDDLRQQYDTNVIGVVRAIQAVLPTFRKQKSGCIVNISSVVGVWSPPFFGLYASSKFALEGISQALQGELAPLGIRVSVVQPGFTKTPFVIQPAQGPIPAEYNAALAGTKQFLEQGLASGAETSVVGDVIFEAATTDQPAFHWQCTEKDAAQVAGILKDPRGFAQPGAAAAAAH